MGHRRKDGLIAFNRERKLDGIKQHLILHLKKNRKKLVWQRRIGFIVLWC